MGSIIYGISTVVIAGTQKQRGFLMPKGYAVQINCELKFCLQLSLVLFGFIIIRENGFMHSKEMRLCSDKWKK